MVWVFFLGGGVSANVHVSYSVFGFVTFTVSGIVSDYSSNDVPVFDSTELTISTHYISNVYPTILFRFVRVFFFT